MAGSATVRAWQISAERWLPSRSAAPRANSPSWEAASWNDSLRSGGRSAARPGRGCTVDDADPGVGLGLGRGRHHASPHRDRRRGDRAARGSSPAAVPTQRLCLLFDAAHVLRALAAELARAGAVAISGRTAPVEPGSGVQLAECRARAPADLLLPLEVPASSITDVRGDGDLLDPPRGALGRMAVRTTYVSRPCARGLHRHPHQVLTGPRVRPAVASRHRPGPRESRRLSRRPWAGRLARP